MLYSVKKKSKYKTRKKKMSRKRSTKAIFVYILLLVSAF